MNNEQQQDEETLRINETPIPEVSSTKFLGVKFTATGMLKCMRDNIPKEQYKPL